ncbi:hypothetical protein pdam_00024562 [Pocillopora damicornis]|uniref:Uncharacterized protein n=1 Tax=Pocillopora damicornis TaxID=46731 RepID=A0A3M6U259_POCDA|nr:hypothetical protein pdam_00024562 [Pocillopora damicornis]
MCVFLFLLSLVFSELRRFFIFDMERLVFTTSLSTLIEVRQINLGKGAKLEVEKFPVEADHYIFRALYKLK